jgi:prepilin-type N-terminal cleavage/methylation domain-containing protein
VNTLAPRRIFIHRRFREAESPVRASYEALRAARAFTLVELLVVIAIIGILAAIIIPVVGKVREAARKAVNVSNIRQIAIAHLMFRSDHKGIFPRLNDDTHIWSDTPQADGRKITIGNKFAPVGYLIPYLSLNGPAGSFTQTPDVLMCPFFQRDTTGYNVARGLQHTIKYQTSLFAGYQLNSYAAIPTFAGYTEYHDPDVPSRRAIIADLTNWWDGSLNGVIKNGGPKPWNGSGFHVGTWGGSARWIKAVNGFVSGANSGDYWAKLDNK